jgi:non-ribosomal peptide synthetase component E (peptide arylation enzyme)
MDKIWKPYWPRAIEESSVRLPKEPLTRTLKRQAQRVPDRPALIFYGRNVSFAELDSATDRMAGWLRRRGIEPGDRVAIFMENCPQLAIAYFGALKAGAGLLARSGIDSALVAGRLVLHGRYRSGGCGRLLHH